MSDTIEYGNLMHNAMRGLIQQVLQEVLDHGDLPGEHHFFITFDTLHPDVEIADWLSDRYPGEMTIVMQHWYDNLEVTDQGFAVTLNFGDSPEPLYIPYNAIKTFVDPSVEFGLRFETEEGEDDDDNSPVELVRDEPDVAAELTAKEEPADESEKQSADVVSLDAFRKP
ncbi:MAG: SspB family protein [Planktomarina sp.]